MFSCNPDRYAADIDRAWRDLRNKVVRMFCEDELDPPDAEEIAIQAEHGFETAEEIYAEIRRQRKEEGRC